MRGLFSKSVRIVGGTAGGRRIQSPKGSGTRPTSDRVREAVFSMLSSLGGLRDATVLDLFAGSGALGLEALSQGARRAVFVESSAAGVAAIRANLAVLGRTQGGAEVVRGDAVDFAARCGRFDIVFADPPYAFTRWAEVLPSLAGKVGLAVLETSERTRGRPGVSSAGSADFESERSPAGLDDLVAQLAASAQPMWETVKAKRYGGTVVFVLRSLATVGPAQEGNF